MPLPLTSRKIPFTGITPMDLLFSRTLELRGSRTHSPVRVPPFSRSSSAGAVIDGPFMMTSLSHRLDSRCHLCDTPRPGSVTDGFA